MDKVSYHHLNRYYKLIDHYRKLNLQKSHNLYTENHHITPKCMGGSDSTDNLVRLPARAHYIAHWLLWKSYGAKLANAFLMMRVKTKHQSLRTTRFTSKQYEILKIQFSKNMSVIRANSSYTSWNKGLTKQTSEKLKNIGYKISKTKTGVPSKRKGLKSSSHSQKTKELMSRNRKGKYLWWNNGITNKRGTDCPGPGWIRGRIH